MRETIDCAVLMTPGHEAWVRAWAAPQPGPTDRLRLHVQELSMLAPGAPDSRLLARARLALRRFDGCVLPVAPATLPWVRTVLANAQGQAGAAPAVPATPLVAIVFDLTAPAILDLLALGAADFIRAPVCLDELRARLVRARRGPGMSAAAPAGYSLDPAGGALVQEAALPYGACAASQAGRAPLLRARLNSSPVVLPGHDTHPCDEPFRQAKARVVDGFEREYLRRALSLHAGNVAQAARASSKHRRAFWALMRKHRIDAAPYRQNSTDHDASE